jgi:iron-sulfur cluster repair protein YtfE (RIC family)
MQNQIALATVIRYVLKPHHSLLRKEVERAADLTGSVIVEQRPPLCRTLLPLYRRFQGFRLDLEDHLDAQDARLFPHLLDIEIALGQSSEQERFLSRIRSPKICACSSMDRSR